MLIFFIALGIATGVPLCFLFDVNLPCRIAIGAGLSLAGFIGWLFLYILGLFIFSLFVSKKKKPHQGSSLRPFFDRRDIALGVSAGQSEDRYRGDGENARGTVPFGLQPPLHV